MSTETTSVIDREKQCPFLLRVFYGPGEKPRESEITSSEAPELQIYTWKDATLGEISLAIKKAIPDMIAQAGPGCLLEFRHMTVEADRSSYTGRDIGTVRLDQVLSISGTRSAPDQEGGISTRDIHSNVKDSNRRSDRHSKSDRPNKSYEKTLKMVRHEPGDFLTVAVASADPDEEEEEEIAEMDEEEVAVMDEEEVVVTDEEQVVVMEDVEETETADPFAMVDREEDDKIGTDATDGTFGVEEE
ncbi:hypothetical protein BGZ81_001725 [Podila clonocystis]|nr:hypothetical protein BGZ81_001725 [Podila clonocystis]